VPLVRTGAGEDSRLIQFRGPVWDHADLLASVGRATLRSMVDGPWGKADADLARELVRRTHTDPCREQCFIVAHTDGTVTKKGCGCVGSGWQYTNDPDVEVLNGKCPPRDVWNDGRSLLYHHSKQGRGDKDPIYCDCDDLTIVCAAVAKYEAWVAAGKPTHSVRTLLGNSVKVPDDPPGLDVCGCITKPPDSMTAHAFVLAPWVLAQGEPEIRVGALYVFDPAGRWGMRRPKDSFYGRGDVAPFPLRFRDLLPELQERG